MNNELILTLDNEKFDFESGMRAYEKLGTSKESDRYEYVLPYYRYNKVFDEKFFNGSLSFSPGSNNLNNTNNLNQIL